MAKAKVFIVKYEYQADYKVYFVDRDHKEQNAEIIKGGELVNQDYRADVKVFIVTHEHKAGIKITRKNFPS